nr:hypothetical protein BaRGS_012173 [Batillaria attramentaria]
MTVVYFFLDLSSWLLAALSLERLFSVCRPLSVKTTCTRRTSFAIISVIVIVLLGLNAHFLFTHGELTVTFGDQTRTFSCISLTDDYFHFFAKVWPWIDLSVFALFPLIIQVIANTLIVTRVIISYLSIISIESQATTSFGATSSTPGARGSVTFLGIDNETPSASEFQSQQHPATGNDASSGDKETSCVDDGEKVKNATSSASAQAGGRSTGAQNRKDTTGQQMKNKTEKKTSSASTKPSPDRRRSSAAQQDKIVSSMTIMLVAVSLTFCVCTIPISVFVIHSFIEPDYHPRLRVVWVAVNLAMYTNNACNFILYSLSGSRFRAEMKRMWQTPIPICVPHRWLSEVALDIPAWVLVVMAFEKRSLMWFPIPADSRFSRLTAKVIMFVLCVFVMLFQSPPLWYELPTTLNVTFAHTDTTFRTNTVSRGIPLKIFVCDFDTKTHEASFFRGGMAWPNFFLRGVGPYACLLTYMVAVVRKIVRERTCARRLMMTVGISPPPWFYQGIVEMEKTVMVTGTLIVFMFFANFPRAIYEVMLQHKENHNDSGMYMPTFWTVSNMLFYLSYVFVFPLYALYDQGILTIMFNTWQNPFVRKRGTAVASSVPRSRMQPPLT